MQRLQNGYMTTTTGNPMGEQRRDWSSEISTTPMAQGQNRPAVDTGMGGMLADTPMPGGQMMNMGNMGGNNQANMMGNGQMDGGYVSGSGAMSRPGMGGQNLSSSMELRLPTEVVEAPTTVGEAYLGSLKATLSRNKGNFIVATFLLGTQNLMSWEGILYEVGNDFVTIYQPARDRYVVVDMYSLKYMEFYDTQRRELCNEMLRNSGMQGGWQEDRWQNSR